MRTYGIEEVPVVAHHRDDALIVSEEVLEPCYGIYIEIDWSAHRGTGYQGIAKEGLRESAYLLIAIELFDQLEVQVLRYTEVTEQLCSLGLGVPAV
jgi:hypothetical protein